jgi:hypothetical protein
MVLENDFGRIRVRKAKRPAPSFGSDVREPAAGQPFVLICRVHFSAILPFTLVLSFPHSPRWLSVPVSWRNTARYIYIEERAARVTGNFRNISAFISQPSGIRLFPQSLTAGIGG